jgi:hypothetical protein
MNPVTQPTCLANPRHQIYCDRNPIGPMGKPDLVEKLRFGFSRERSIGYEKSHLVKKLSHKIIYPSSASVLNKTSPRKHHSLQGFPFYS